MRGGGIYHRDLAVYGVYATLQNSAVYGNRATVADTGSQLYVGKGPDGTVEVRNSILAQGPAGNLPLCAYSGFYAVINSLGYNIFSDNSCPPLFPQLATDRRNTDPLLGPLADNGGPTKTHLPLAGSPAIDTSTGCGQTDQRGFARPADGDGNGSAVCDVGPVEAGASRGRL
jgi:hypothetical protein